jgi:hypothetical protein
VYFFCHLRLFSYDISWKFVGHFFVVILVKCFKHKKVERAKKNPNGEVDLGEIQNKADFSLDCDQNYFQNSRICEIQIEN